MQIKNVKIYLHIKYFYLEWKVNLDCFLTFDLCGIIWAKKCDKIILNKNDWITVLCELRINILKKDLLGKAIKILMNIFSSPFKIMAQCVLPGTLCH